jgi:hypothetical protein
MVHENLPRKAHDIRGLADAMDALAHANEMRTHAKKMRRGGDEWVGAHEEAAILDAMAPFTGSARKLKPKVEWTTLLGHIKESGAKRKRIASDHHTVLRREMESADSDRDVRIRAAVDAAQRHVDLDLLDLDLDLLDAPHWRRRAGTGRAELK